MARESIKSRDSIAKLLARGPAEFLLISGIGVALFATLSPGRFEAAAQGLVLLGVVLAMSGAAMTMWSFLQREKRRNRPIESWSGVTFERLSAEIEKLKSKPAAPSAFTEDERKKIISDVTSKLSTDTVNQVTAVWVDKFRDKDSDQKHEAIFLGTAEKLIDRLQEEIVALGNRASLNLIIGSLISLLGIAVLTVFVYIATSELSTNARPEDIAVRFAIRLSLAVFIQVFAYFFLRLYRYNIFEIKYFQNEITGAQFKILALVAAMRTKDTKTVDKLCLDLAKTERNFILKKGETTVSLQRDEIEKEYENRMFAMVEKIAGAVKKDSK